MGSDEGDETVDSRDQNAVFQSNASSARMWTGLIIVFGFLEAITLGLLIGLWSFWFVDYVDERTPPSNNIVIPSYAWTCFMSLPHILHVATVVYAIIILFVNRRYIKSKSENVNLKPESKLNKSRTYKNIITFYFALQIINIVGGLIAFNVKLWAEGPDQYAPHNISILGNDGEDDQTSVAQVYSFAVTIVALLLAVFQATWSGILFTMPLKKMIDSARRLKGGNGGGSGGAMQEQQPVGQAPAASNPNTSPASAFYNGSSSHSNFKNSRIFSSGRAPQPSYNRMETENFANVSYNQFAPSSSPYNADDNFSMAVFR